MNEDYLWDKTGSDPEIEKLENALAVFRYQETEPPALPAKILTFEKEPPRRRFFQLAFAFAACAAFVIVSFGVWFQFSGTNSSVDYAAETTAPEKKNELPNTTPIETPDATPSVASDNGNFIEDEAPNRIAKRKVIKIGKTLPRMTGKKELKPRMILADNAIIALSKEERYAYNQLMLALSITSSKLKLVEDKVNGVEEEPKPVNKKGQ